jgi:hypothetical protein
MGDQGPKQRTRTATTERKDLHGQSGPLLSQATTGGWIANFVGLAPT